MFTSFITPTRYTRFNTLTRHALIWLGAAALAVGLQACGGAESSLNATNSTTPTTQLANGVVTGFGSVVVDGVEIEDHKAKVFTDQANGSTKNTTLELGQRVRVVRGSDGAATQITVDAAVSGLVSSIDATANTLTVAAQVVRVNTTNSALPTTYFAGGYTAFADIKAADMVEIHGSPIFNTTTSKYEVQATRIQKLTGGTGFRVMGTVADLNTTAKTFALNGLTVQYGSATLRPTTATLTEGATVVAFSETNGALSGSTLTASSLRVYQSSDTTPEARSTAQVSGIVSNYNASTGLFTLQGLTIKVGTVTPTPTGATIANNTYVMVTGTVNAATGFIEATAIKVRQANVETDLAKIKLIGPISSFDATSKTMVVRNVAVDFEGANITCTQTLADDLVVGVLAQQQADTDVVLATTIACALPAGTVIESYLGAPSAVDTTAKTLTLSVTAASGTATTKSVQWNDNTAFSGVSVDTLASSTKLMVEGYVSNGVLVARSIRAPSTEGGDRFRGADKEKARKEYSDRRSRK